MKVCDYCGRLTETTRWVQDGDEEDICKKCLEWMAAHRVLIPKGIDEAGDTK